MNILITGGGGFLGSTIARQLLSEGHELSIIARNDYPELKALGVTTHQVDITDKMKLDGCFHNIDVVFHTAAKAGVWGPRESYWKINVEGTKNILEAAQKAGVGTFVHTSSPSAVWSGDDEAGLSESDCPYPDNYLAHYPESKAVAERLVLAADKPTFRTTALRPHLIWGAGDPHLVPRLLERHARLRIIGAGQNKVGITHVSNAAHAHVLAMKELVGNAKNAGKAYFITDVKPVVIWEWLNELYTALGYSAVTRKISVRSAIRVGIILQWFWRFFRMSGEPPMTPFVAKQLSTHHYYDLSASINDFGYAQHPDSKQGWDEMIAYFKRSKA